MIDVILLILIYLWVGSILASNAVKRYKGPRVPADMYLFCVFTWPLMMIMGTIRDMKKK